MNRDEVNRARVACVEKIGQVREAHAIHNAVSDARGAEFDRRASVFVHVLLVASDGGADVHLGLAARLIGLVERHQVLGIGGSTRQSGLHIGIPRR